MSKILVIFLFLLTSVFSKEITLDLNKAINLALENNKLSKISKLNLQIAQAQYEQALSANYPSIDAILYASRDRRDTIFQQRGSISLSPEAIKMIAALTPTLNRRYCNCNCN